MGPGAHHRQPARRLRELRRAGGRRRGVLREGQRPPAPGDRPGAGGDARRGAGPAARAARRAHTAALGETRRVDDDQTIRWSSVRYSTPHGHHGAEVWCRVHGDELVIVGDTTERGLRRDRPPRAVHPGPPPHRRCPLPAPPGGQRAEDPKPRPRSDDERAFFGLGEGAERWLVEAGAVGAQRVRTKMARAVELAALVGSSGRSRARPGRHRRPVRRRRPRLDHRPPRRRRRSQRSAIADETHSTQPGTAAWKDLGR